MQDFDSPKLRVQFMVSWTVLESIWCHLDANFTYFGPTWGFFFVAHLVPMPGRAIGTRMALGFLARVPFRDPPFDNFLACWDSFGTHFCYLDVNKVAFLGRVSRGKSRQV